MKILYSISGTVLLYFVFFAGSTQIAGCEKTTVKHDTTVKVVTDTVIKTVTVRDTLTLRDTIYTLTDGMVAYYNFNGGNLNDSSGHNNNITFNNALPAADRFGLANNARVFDGVQADEIHGDAGLFEVERLLKAGGPHAQPAERERVVLVL